MLQAWPPAGDGFCFPTSQPSPAPGIIYLSRAEDSNLSSAIYQHSPPVDSAFSRAITAAREAVLKGEKNENRRCCPLGAALSSTSSVYIVAEHHGTCGTILFLSRYR